MAEVIQPSDLLTASVTGELPDHVIALEFSKLLKRWIPAGEGLAHQRIGAHYRQKNVPPEGRGYQATIKWTALAITLNSLGSVDIDEFRVVRTWANKQENGWLRAFFGAGLFLGHDAEFPWDLMAGFLASVDPGAKELLHDYLDIAHSRHPPARDGNQSPESATARTAPSQTLPGLRTMELRLDEVVERGSTLFGPSEGASGFVGECFAFEYEGLAEDAASQGIGWHVLLVGLSLAALHAERHKRPVLAGYTLDRLPSRVVRLFLCSKPLPRCVRSSRLLVGRRGYIEAGRDLARESRFRPLAYWDPPATAYALWPPPRDARPGPWAINPGNELGCWSFPQSDHTKDVYRMEHDYVRVPQERRSCFRVDETEIVAENRWAVLR